MSTNEDRPLIPTEEVAGIYFGLDVVETGVVAVGDDGLGEKFELAQIVYDEASEECGTVFEGGFVDDDFCSLCLDAFHNALDAGLAEIVGIGFHREAINADYALFFCAGTIVATIEIVVVASFLQHLVGNEVLAGTITLNDCRHHVLRHIVVVCKELLCVLGETVAAVAKGGIVVVGAYAWVEAYSLNDCLRVESLDFGIGIEFVEVADAEGEVCVCEELDGLGLLHAH